MAQNKESYLAYFEHAYKSTFRHWGITDERFLEKLFRPVANAYLDSRRHYHGIVHVATNDIVMIRFADCAQEIYKARVKNAYHDAVCEAGANDNEKRSADWAAEDLLRCRLFSTKFIDDIYFGIMATTHGGNLVMNDDMFMADTDLSGLGSPWETFVENGQNVRREYAHLTDDEWRTGHATSFLQSILARKHIYYLKPFRDCFERQARANIERGIAELTQKNAA